MPFISVKVLQSEVAPEFISFSAGSDQNVICASIVELDAQILVGDINDHIFEWEQIEGTPVTLEDSNTLTPWFVNPNTTDLVFRLWIDRGTPFEKFSDVNVFREITSIASSTITEAGESYVPTVIELGRHSSEVRMPATVDVAPTSYSDQNGTYTPGTCKNGPYSIMWTQPTGISKYNILLGIEVQKLVNGVWVTEGIQIPERRYWNIENGVTYRLVVIWNDLLRNVVSRETSGEIYRAPESKYTRNAFTSVATGMSSSGASELTSFTIFITTLISKEVESTATPGITISGAAELTSFSTFVPGLVACPDNETFCTPAPSSSGTIDPNIFVSRVGGISIGEL